LVFFKIQDIFDEPEKFLGEKDAFEDLIKSHTKDLLTYLVTHYGGGHYSKIFRASRLYEYPTRKQAHLFLFLRH